MSGSMEETSIKSQEWLVVSGAVNSDTSNEVYLFTVRVLGYVPEGDAEQALPDCLLPFLGPESSLTRHDYDDSSMTLVRYTGPPMSLSKFCGTLNALKGNALGYFAQLILESDLKSRQPDNILMWLSGLTDTPKVMGRNKAFCTAAAEFTRGEVTEESPLDEHGFGPWIRDAHTTFRRHYSAKHLRELDHFLGGV